MMSSACECDVPATAARAIALAWPTFERHVGDRGARAEDYRVMLIAHNAMDEIVFVPRPDPGRSKRGGETLAGPEFHCWVARGDGTVIRTSGAR